MAFTNTSMRVAARGLWLSAALLGACQGLPDSPPATPGPQSGNGFRQGEGQAQAWLTIGGEQLFVAAGKTFGLTATWELGDEQFGLRPLDADWTQAGDVRLGDDGSAKLSVPGYELAYAPLPSGVSYSLTVSQPPAGYASRPGIRLGFEVQGLTPLRYVADVPGGVSTVTLAMEDGASYAELDDVALRDGQGAVVPVQLAVEGQRFWLVSDSATLRYPLVLTARVSVARHPAPLHNPRLCPINACAGAATNGGTTASLCTASSCHGCNSCVAGTCTPRPAGSTCPSSNPCTFNQCDGSGVCVAAGLVAPGAACPSGDPCAPGMCQSATCTPTPIVCTASDLCHDVGVCAGGACSDPPKTLSCPPSDGCHLAGACDPASGGCTNPQAAAGTPCSSGNACEVNEACDANGACAGTATACAAADQCHGAGACDPATGVCSTPATPGAACDAGVCTESAQCSADGSSCAGTAKVCAAQDDCHRAGACDGTTGLCDNPTEPDGTPCGAGGVCRSGVCSGASGASSTTTGGAATTGRATSAGTGSAGTGSAATGSAATGSATTGGTGPGKAASTGGSSGGTGGAASTGASSGSASGGAGASTGASAGGHSGGGCATGSGPSALLLLGLGALLASRRRRAPA